MPHSSKILGAISDQQQEHKLGLMKVLKNYVPAEAVEWCSELIMYYKLHLHIEVERKDRYGDYHPEWGRGNRISINHNLNPYEFLLTFVHELAHHTTFLKFGSKVQSHGAEWKEEFKKNIVPFLDLHIFPTDVADALMIHMRNPKYTHSADVRLMKALMSYDKKKDYVTLDQLKEGELFKLSEKARTILQKGPVQRTYARCLSPSNGKTYLVHALAKIIPVKTAH